MPEKLAVNAEGKLTISPRVLEKRCLRPGDELLLVEAAEGLLLYQHGVDSLAARWWNSLREDERGQTQAEARRYQGLSEEEHERIWGEGAGSIEYVMWG